MKQMFKTCENTYKVFYHITFMEICKSYKNVPKDLYVKIALESQIIAPLQIQFYLVFKRFFKKN